MRAAREIDSLLDLTGRRPITEEDRVVTISHGGPKTQPVSAYQTQRRGGMGKAATAVKMRICRAFGDRQHPRFHLCFTDQGKVLLAEGLSEFPSPAAPRAAAPMVNLLSLDEGRAHYRHSAGAGI